MTIRIATEEVLSSLVEKIKASLDGKANSTHTHEMSEINGLVETLGNIHSFDVQVVSTLPENGEERTIYFVPKEDSDTENVYDEYLLINGSYELIGDTQLDLTGYVTETELTEGLATKSDTGHTHGYEDIEDLTEIEDADIIWGTDPSDGGTVEALHTHPNLDVLDTITSSKVNSWDAKSDFSGNYNDLTNKPVIPDVSNLATKTELTEGLATKAEKSELHNHDNKDALDKVTDEKITEWDAKSDFDGDYNSLTNKPNIPSATSQLTNDSSFVTESEMNTAINNAQLGGDSASGGGMDYNMLNAFDPNRSDNIEDRSLSGGGGTVGAVGLGVSHKIKVSEGETIHFKTNLDYVCIDFHNSEGTYLSEIVEEAVIGDFYTFTVPSGACYARFDYEMSTASDVVFACNVAKQYSGATLTLGKYEIEFDGTSDVLKFKYLGW